MIANKRAESLSLHNTYRRSGTALFIARAQLGEEIKRDFFRSLFTHPLDHWKVFSFLGLCNVLILHGPLYCINTVNAEINGYKFRKEGSGAPYQIGSSKGFYYYGILFLFYGAILSSVGALYALRGVRLFGGKGKAWSVPDKEEALQCALLFHVLGFSIIHGIIGVACPNYMMHATFLLGFLGWWAIADFVKIRRKKCAKVS